MRSSLPARRPISASSLRTSPGDKAQNWSECGSVLIVGLASAQLRQRPAGVRWRESHMVWQSGQVTVPDDCARLPWVTPNGCAGSGGAAWMFGTLPSDSPATVAASLPSAERRCILVSFQQGFPKFLNDSHPDTP